MNNLVQFIDLEAQQKRIYPQLEQRIKAVLSHGKYIMGPEVFELEQQLSEFIGAKHTITCASGTDALLMGLMAKGIGPGDAVFTTPFTFIATAETITLLGATPVFVDIELETFNMDPVKLEQAIEALLNMDRSKHPLPGAEYMSISPLKPKGIIGVDLFGLPANYSKINRIAQKYNMFVIEDAAQSFGASLDNHRACNLAEISATSFFPAKPLGCYGDGGAVFTNDDYLADKLRSIRIHGKGNDKYDNVRIGINGRLDTLQAAILLEKLRIFPDEIDQRNYVAQMYSEHLSGIVKTPFTPKGYSSVWAQYSILSENRGNLQKRLEENGIPTAIYYPKPLHLQTAYSFLKYENEDFPVSEYCSNHIFSLPMHPYLTDDQIFKITKIIKNNS
ncbi:MAG: DegT/DnrJ/EryC1/StrS family aminotransferase [Desulfobacula sp.]|nr:DegT/DnrJ/EryC1/StrS family aminotransferase [Desulfobacula sp.]